MTDDIMNDSRTAVMMDSGCDLPYELCVKEGIEYLPLHVIYPEKDYRDGIDIDPMMIYDRYPAEIPTTSTPYLQEVTECFEKLVKKGYRNVIAVTISSALSGTWNTISLAAREFSGLNIHVFDTRNISFGSGVFALWAARKVREGIPFEELVKKLYEKRGDSRQFFYMDTLEYLRRGGRIGRVSSIIGEMLHIKPIISCDPEGVYYTVAKIRGQLLAKKKLLNEVISAVGGRRCWIIVGEGKAHEEALRMKEILQEKLSNMEFLFMKQINATLALNTGPGLVGVMTFVDP